MNILLLRPAPDPQTIGLQHVMLMEPLELEVLGALVKPPDQTVIVDMILEREPLTRHLQRERPHVLCVTGYITSVPAMIEACRLAKELDPGITTVVGGVHCEVCPEDLDHPAIDFRMVRNAVKAFPVLLTHIKAGGDLPPGVLRPSESLQPDQLPPMDFSFPLPDRSLTKRYRHRYFYIFHDKVATIKTAFGCPFRCSFCFCRQITAGLYHERPLDQVMDELESITETEIYIVDDDFLVSRDRVERFLEALEARDIHKHYLLYGRADFVAANPKLMERFRNTGLRTVIVGFESFDSQELETYRKGVPAAVNEDAMRVLNSLGIECYATIIIPPHWDKDAFERCERKLRDLGIRFVNLQPLTPLPGTGLTWPDEDLVIPRSDFSKWDLAHVTIRPEKLSVADFYQAIIDLYMKTIYWPPVLLDHLKYPKRMLWKMLRGSFAVRRQYQDKIKEAKRLA